MTSKPKKQDDDLLPTVGSIVTTKKGQRGEVKELDDDKALVEVVANDITDSDWHSVDTLTIVQYNHTV